MNCVEMCWEKWYNKAEIDVICVLSSYIGGLHVESLIYWIKTGVYDILDVSQWKYGMCARAA